MRWVAVITVAAAAACLVCASPQPAKYTTKYDNLDIEQILGSQRLLNNYFNCLMDKGPCTPEGSELRRHIPDALKTECSKCSDTQKKKGDRAYNWLIKNRPDLFKELEMKYDPTGIYKARQDSKKGKEGKPVAKKA